MKTLEVAIIQMNVRDNKEENLQTAYKFIKKACKYKIDLAVLPEMFLCPYENSSFPKYAENEDGVSYEFLSNIAKEFGIYLVAGSIPEKDKDNNIYNTSYIFDRQGNEIGKHRKIHLFDIQIEGGQCFRESDTLSPGADVTVFNTEFGKIGVNICYDFRFPELSRLMVDKGAKVIITPAAFNMTTGPAHWEVLFRSRAIDNQVYTIGCAPSRSTNSTYVSYGNSIIVSPFGIIIDRMDENEGFMVSTIDFSYVDKIRNELPLLKHRKSNLY
ncbi:carbon-nitrogen hydrolase family protein [Romboutsia sp.]|uniref:carbon-nitrogen hydrolase family protein n=1 Tax=Romboutsia sp. TaxID=1965302 RepID=UPI003F2E8749